MASSHRFSLAVRLRVQSARDGELGADDADGSLQARALSNLCKMASGHSLPVRLRVRWARDPTEIGADVAEAFSNLCVAQHQDANDQAWLPKMMGMTVDLLMVSCGTSPVMMWNSTPSHPTAR